MRSGIQPNMLENCIINPDTVEPSLALSNSVEPDQLASKNCTVCRLGLWILYLQSGLSNLIGRKLEVGMAS